MTRESLVRPLHVGLVGVGRIASAYVEALTYLEEIELAGLSDTDRNRAVKRAETLGLGQPEIRNNLGEMLTNDGVEAVCLCTPHDSHAALAVEALRRGRHVLIEKPVCLSRSELAAIEEASSESPELVVAVAHQNRHIPLMQAVRTVVREHIGEVCHARLELACHRDADYYRASPWKGRWDTEGGSLGMNQGIHLIDLCLWMLGPVRLASGWWSNRWMKSHIETEDTLSGLLEMNGGVSVTVSMTGNAPVSFQPRMEIRGVRGYVSFEAGYPPRLLECELHPEAEHLLQTAQHRPLLTRTREATPPWRVSHFELLRDFAQACRGGGVPLVGLSEAFESVSVVQALYRSGNEGHRPVEPDHTGPRN